MHLWLHPVHEARKLLRPRPPNTVSSASEASQYFLNGPILSRLCKSEFLFFVHFQSSMLNTTTMHNAHVQSSEQVCSVDVMMYFFGIFFLLYTSVYTVSIHFISFNCNMYIIHIYICVCFLGLHHVYTLIFQSYHLRAQLQKRHTMILLSPLQSRNPRQ